MSGWRREIVKAAKKAAQRQRNEKSTALKIDAASAALITCR